MLAWLDIETTGLDPDTHRILEVAIVITDDGLNELGHKSEVYPCSVRLNELSDAVLDIHMTNGLLLEASKAVSPRLGLTGEFCHWLGWAFPFVDFETVPLAGSSIHFDRAFLKRHMPSLESCFHYRNVDVSTIKELLKRWRPEWAIENTDKAHRALPDARASIAELRRYCDLLRLGPQAPWEE